MLNLLYRARTVSIVSIKCILYILLQLREKWFNINITATLHRSEFTILHETEFWSSSRFNKLCLSVRRLTVNNYSTDVIRMWPEADNYDNLITRHQEPESEAQEPPLIPHHHPHHADHPLSSVMRPVLTTLYQRVITGSACQQGLCR